MSVPDLGSGNSSAEALRTAALTPAFGVPLGTKVFAVTPDSTIGPVMALETTGLL
jgi:hypothetical protein